MANDSRGQNRRRMGSKKEQPKINNTHSDNFSTCFLQPLWPNTAAFPLQLPPIVPAILVNGQIGNRNNDTGIKFLRTLRYDFVVSRKKRKSGEFGIREVALGTRVLSIQETSQTSMIDQQKGHGKLFSVFTTTRRQTSQARWKLETVPILETEFHRCIIKQLSEVEKGQCQYLVYDERVGSFRSTQRFLNILRFCDSNNWVP